MLKVSYIDLKTGKYHITFLTEKDYILFVYNNINLIKVKEVIKIDKTNY